MDLPKIAVIILNWNGWDYTIPCVNSCLRANYPALRVIVVDNGSTKPVADNRAGGQVARLTEQYSADSRVQILPLADNLGYAGGNNQGIKTALSNPDISGIIILNNDATVAPDFFRQLVLTAQSPIAPAMINARVMKMSAPEEIDNLGLEMTLGLLAFNRLNNHSTLFCPSGCAVFYTRQLLEKIRLPSISETDYFDPAYFCYAEDLDLGWRALMAGFTPAIADRALVYHAGSASAGAMSDFSVYHSYRNLIWTAIKCLPRWYWPLWLIPMLLAYGGLLALYIARGRASILLKAYWHGLRAWPRLIPLRHHIQKTTAISTRQLLRYFSYKIYSLQYLKSATSTKN